MLKKIKKLFVSVPIFIVFLSTKVLGLNVLEIDSNQQDLYGASMVSRTTLILRIVRAIGIILIPVVIIIGIIVYVKKKHKKQREEENNTGKEID